MFLPNCERVPICFAAIGHTVWFSCCEYVALRCQTFRRIRQKRLALVQKDKTDRWYMAIGASSFRTRRVTESMERPSSLPKLLGDGSPPLPPSLSLYSSPQTSHRSSSPVRRLPLAATLYVLNSSLYVRNTRQGVDRVSPSSPYLSCRTLTGHIVSPSFRRHRRSNLAAQRHCIGIKKKGLQDRWVPSVDEEVVHKKDRFKEKAQV